MKPHPLEDEKQREAHPDDIGIPFDGQKVASDSQWCNCRLSGTEGNQRSNTEHDRYHDGQQPVHRGAPPITLRGGEREDIAFTDVRVVCLLVDRIVASDQVSIRLEPRWRCGMLPGELVRAQIVGQPGEESEEAPPVHSVCEAR